MNIFSRIKILILALVFVFVSVGFVFADYVESPWIYKVYENGTIAITGYAGNAEDCYVPWELAGMDVKYIEKNAFAGTDVKTIHIPNNSVTIDGQAYPEGVEVYLYELIDEKMTEVPIHEGVFEEPENKDKNGGGTGGGSAFSGGIAPGETPGETAPDVSADEEALSEEKTVAPFDNSKTHGVYNDEIKALVAKTKITVRTKNLKKGIKVYVNESPEIKKIKKKGYKVRYDFYRACSNKVPKNSKYVKTKIVNKEKPQYLNTSVKKGKRYYYKAIVRVYDNKGRFVVGAETTLKQGVYGTRKRK